MMYHAAMLVLISNEIFLIFLLLAHARANSCELTS